MKIWSEKVGNKYVWHGDATVNKERLRPRNCAKKSEVIDIFAAARTRARAERYGLDTEPEVVTLGELCDERRKDFDERRAGHRHIIRVMERFTAHLGEERAVHTVKAADLRSFVQSLREKNPCLSPVSVNSYLNHVNSMLRKASEYFPALESWKSPKMPFEDEPKPLDRVITEEEIARLFFALRAPAGVIGERRPRQEKPGEVRMRQTTADLFDFLLLTGMRKTEARTLTKNKIDWQVRTIKEVTIYGFIQLPPASVKTKEPRRIPLNWDARQLLERRCKESPCPWVFPNLAENGPVSDSTTGRILRRIGQRAGLSYGREIEGGFTTHTCRHTAITKMLEEGAHLKTVGRIVGHADATMTMRYGHATFPALAQAVATLGSGPKDGSGEAATDKNPTEKNERAEK